MTTRGDGILTLLLGLYVVVRILQVLPLGIPLLPIVVLHVSLPLVFAFLHGARSYGIRGMLLFCGLGLVVGNGFENLSIATGFPFGHYYFTAGMGPKLFQVPISLGLAYLGMGYLSWTLGRVLVGARKARLRGAQVLLVPLVASVAMVAWDLAMDPAWGTVLRLWVWRDGGKWFGVPLSNFLGWFITVYLFLQLFALSLRKEGEASLAPGPFGSMPAGYWRLAALFYLASALGNVLLMMATRGMAGIANPVTRSVTDPTGVVWRVGDIALASGLVSLLMVGLAGLAMVRVGRERDGAGEAEKGWTEV